MRIRRLSWLFLTSRVSILDLKLILLVLLNTGEKILDKFLASNEIGVLDPFLQLGLFIPYNKVEYLMF